MMSSNSGEITRILRNACDGNREELDRLASLVYDEFRRLAAHYLKREGEDHSLQPTALVNEAYLKLVDGSQVDWQGRTHFFAVGARAMRQILVDHAKARLAHKRGGGRHRVQLREDLAFAPRKEEDVLALDEAINRLAELDERQARIVELRFFGGLTVAEVAEVLQVSKRTVEKEWTMVRAWLRRELSEDEPQ